MASRKTKYAEQALLEREIKMLKSPGDWPRWPFLPVKRWDSKLRTNVCGYVVECGLDTPPRIDYKVFEHPKDAETPWKVLAEYKTAEEMVADGWRVD